MLSPGIFYDTFLESFRNKMFLFFFIVSSLIVGSIGLALDTSEAFSTRRI